MRLTAGLGSKEPLPTTAETRVTVRHWHCVDWDGEWGGFGRGMGGIWMGNGGDLDGEWGGFGWGMGRFGPTVFKSLGWAVVVYPIGFGVVT